MRKILTFILAALAIASACTPEELGPTIPVPEDQGEGSQLDAPGVRIIDVKTDGFTANWKKVADAKQYEYIFDDQEAEVTSDTTIVFTGLAVDTEHILRITALPRIESGRLPSPQVIVNVVTNEIGPLDAPSLTAGSTYSSMCVISWSVVPLAVEYEWELSGGSTGRTDKTFITFSGLIEGREYTLRVRSLCGDDPDHDDSQWSEIKFIPVNDGSAKLLSSDFKTTADGISFDIYASAGQYYWYDIVPLVSYAKHESEEAYLATLKASIDSKAQALIAAGTDSKEAYAQVLKSGSTNVLYSSYANLSYRVTLAGMGLDGEFTGNTVSKLITTPDALQSDGPQYKSAGDWFTQTLSLGTTTSAPPTTTLSIRRSGTGVVSLQYLLYTTDKFIKTFGATLDDDAIGKVKDTVGESGTAASDENVVKLNSGGYGSSYPNRTPGTSYTLVALAQNERGEQILCINSIRTRTSEADNNWISGSLSTLTTTGFTRKVTLADGLDAVSGKWYCALRDEVTAAYSPAQYRELIQTQGTELTADQTAMFASKGYTTIPVDGLTSATYYFFGVAVTNSTGDTTIHTSTTIKTK